MYRASPLGLNRGFSLLEVLVAIAIAALSLGVLLSLFAGSSRSAKLNQDYHLALQLAESKLDEVASNPQQWLNQHQGENNQYYRWKSQVSTYETDQASPLRYPFVLYQIQIDVSWGERNDYPVSLSTLRLGERS